MDIFHMFRRLRKLNWTTPSDQCSGLFVVTELFSIFINFVKMHRIRLSLFIDVTIVLILREMTIKFYANSVSDEELLELDVLLVVMVIARSITGRYSPKSD